MAQYYQVLSQGGGNKTTVEDLKQYYPNLIEANQNVQYVISPEDQQFSAGQQILVSSEQLMVIDNSQHVIVEQTPVTYQNQQYIVQDTVTEFQDGRTQQQVYYMEEIDNNRIQNEAQPVVLNHQLQSTSSPPKTPVTMNVVKTLTSTGRLQEIQQSPQAQSSTVRQIIQTTHSTPHHVHHKQAHILQYRNPTVAQLRHNLKQNLSRVHVEQQQKVPNRGTSCGSTPSQIIPPEVPSLHFTQPEVKQSEIVESDNHEAVALADGTIMSLSAYKQMFAESKRTIALNQPKASVLPPPPLKYCSNQPKPNRSANRGGRGGKRNVNRITGNPLEYPAQSNGSFPGHPQLARVRTPMKSSLPQSQFNMARHAQAQQAQAHQPSLPQPQTQQHSNKPQLQPYKQPQYIIHPPSQRQQQPICPLPSFVASSQIQQIIQNTPVSEEYSDSIRMLVLLEDGEQRLITFTLPKEQCTIQEILEQVAVPFRPDTKIECTETNQAGIDYYVTVGSCHSDSLLIREVEEPEQAAICEKGEPEVPQPPPSPEPTIEFEQPKYIVGVVAVCNHCGITSENLARCLRCKSKLPEDIKTVSISDANLNNIKKADGSLDKKFIKGLAGKIQNGGVTNRKKKVRAVDIEPVVVTVSSDDEEEESAPNSQSETQQMLKRISSSVTLSAIKKEPSISDLQQTPLQGVDSSNAVRGGGKEDPLDTIENSEISTSLLCRTIRIGSYKYIPKENFVVKSKGIILKVPSPQDPTEIKKIVIERKHMVKVLANFQKSLPVIFFYVTSAVGQTIREQLGMVEGSDIYFDPLSEEETYKRITILPEVVTEETKVVFKHIYSKPSSIMEELTIREANDILVKTCPKELSKVVLSAGYTEIKTILIYPPGKGGISINTEDYLCLAQDQFLNDVIIDFYLKYLILSLPQEQQDKVHVFSTFFYKRLTTRLVMPNKKSQPTEVDANLTAAQKRHARVEKWTKRVNLFEKDYIIIPINESSHWFLAIICFPSMNGCTTLDGKPVILEPMKKKKPIIPLLGSTISITPIKKEKPEKVIPCDLDDDASDKDEAEGDDSELESSEENEEPEVAEPTPLILRGRGADVPPIRQPCILIFDSLAGVSRSPVVATLREYLTCEYKVKMGVDRVFDKDTIIGLCPKIPQQNNYTDCGLYLLQYVEQFFEDPIIDYRKPIKHLKEWFDEFVVTKKREDISNLIMDLMLKYNRDPSLLPDIQFPTLNGKLVMRNPEDEDEFLDDFMEEEEEEDEEDETPTDLDTSGDMMDGSELHKCETPRDPSSTAVPIKLNLTKHVELKLSQEEESDKECKNTLVAPTVLDASNLSPNTSEIQKQSSRATLSYLKSKRIHRHKNSDNVDVKKFKPTL